MDSIIGLLVNYDRLAEILE